jgi:hypothetical protein
MLPDATVSMPLVTVVSLPVPPPEIFTTPRSSAPISVPPERTLTVPPLDTEGL